MHICNMTHTHCRLPGICFISIIKCVLGMEKYLMYLTHIVRCVGSKSIGSRLLHNSFSSRTRRESGTCTNILNHLGFVSDVLDCTNY